MWPKIRLEELADGRYKTVGANEIFTKEEIIEVIDREPSRLSSSALLRPIMQDFLFSPLIYVGGAAEEKYFQQIKGIYTLFSVAPCKFVPRASYVLLESKAQRLLKQLNLSNDEISSPSTNLLELVKKKSISEKYNSHNVEEKYRKMFIDIFVKMENELSDFDLGVVQQIAKTRDKNERNLDGFFEKYKQIEENRIKTELDRLDKLQTIILPNAKAQERVYSFVYYWCKYGDDFINILKRNFLPFKKATIAIEL